MGTNGASSIVIIYFLQMTKARRQRYGHNQRFLFFMDDRC